MARKKDEKFEFEANMQKLAVIVEKIEGGELNLEEAMQQFEQGVKLTKECHQALQAAEQKVKILVAQAGDYQLKDFINQDDEFDQDDETDEDEDNDATPSLRS